MRNLASCQGMVQIIPSVHELLPSGGVNGINSMTEKDYEQYNIPTYINIMFEADGKIESLKKLKDKIERVQEILNE